MPKAKRETRARSRTRSSSRGRSLSQGRSTRTKSTPVTSPKSPARRSKSPTKAPTRRSKSPTKAPTRRSKSPTKSPARSKSPTKSRSTRSKSKSPARSTRSKSKSPARSTRARSPARSIPKKSKPKGEPTPPTRISSRIAALEEEKTLLESKQMIEQVIQAKVFEDQNISADEEEEGLLEKKKSLEETKLLETPAAADIKDSKVEDDKKVRKTTKKEFGGTIGVTFIMLALPAVVFTLIQMCHKNKCSISTVPKIPKNWKYYLDPRAAGIVGGWFFLQALLAVLPWGKVVDGQTLVDGTRLRYRCNGFRAFLLTLVMFGLAVYMQLPLSMVYDKLFPLMVASTILSLLFSILFYLKSRRAPATALAPGGNSGNFLYDFFIGHELNPRIGPLDLKFFFDLRMSLISWLVINLCFVLKATQDKDGCPPSLIAVTIFQGLYVADALWFEEAFLTTLDILHDGFGFMLAFGNLVYVPFLYSLQGLYLVRHKVALPYYILAVITFLNVVGYVIFRGSNSQKNEFRRDPFKPSMAHLDSIPTISGRRLLVSGWWKLCRKPNYLGDIIMAVSWSLTCGFGSIMPYFYPIYVTIFLIHRERRDAAHCQQKHGISWERYCSAVKYRIFPYIY